MIQDFTNDTTLFPEMIKRASTESSFGEDNDPSGLDLLDGDGDDMTDSAFLEMLVNIKPIEGTSPPDTILNLTMVSEISKSERESEHRVLWKSTCRFSISITSFPLSNLFHCHLSRISSVLKQPKQVIFFNVCKYIWTSFTTLLSIITYYKNILFFILTSK